MNDVIKYEAVNASDNVGDMFDQDNFYPMNGEGEYDTAGGGSYDGLGEVYDTDNYGYFSGLDTDGEGLDIEYSEAFGDFAKKVGGLFKKGGIKAAVEGRRSGLNSRLSKREERIRGRQDRKRRRKASRDVRKNLRQVAMFENQPPIVNQKLDEVLIKNPNIRPPVEKTKNGFADPTEEQIAAAALAEANKMAINPNKEPADINLNNGVVEVNDGWWAKQRTGVKVAIIGGGVVVLGLGIYLLTKKK